MSNMRLSIPRWLFSVGSQPRSGFGVHTALPRPVRVRQYASTRSFVRVRDGPSGKQPRAPKVRRAAVLLAAGGTAATVGVLAFTDDIKHGYAVLQRSGRVASTLFVCVNDYRTTLSKRQGIESEAERATLLSECHKRCAVRTLKALEKNGGVFIKLGQHISALGYLLPVEWTTTFVPLQDRCPVSSYESIEAMFERDTGDRLLDYFSNFSREPIGAASLAQVHLATVRETGQTVAVKVQHPSLEEWAPLDLALTKFTFAALKRFFPDYDLGWLSSEMESSLPKELDFRLEATNAMRTKEHFSHMPEMPLVVPDVLWATERILVMANETGHRLDDLEYLDANRIDRDEVAASLAHIFNEMIFGDGAPLHCDPHGGNLAIRKATPSLKRGGRNFEIILYDHGLYRDIPPRLRRSYAKMWLAIIDGDVPRMKQYAGEVGGVGEDEFPLFAAAITGRDIRVVTSSILTPKSDIEKEQLGAEALDLLPELVQLLGKVPRVVLLILKTNDLTRSLDESLHTRQGPVRQFLILARYCARTVFHEQRDDVRQSGPLFWPPNTLRLMTAWLSFVRVELKLYVFEIWLRARSMLGLRSMDMGVGSL